jgi:hypothetical protein
MQLSYTQCKQLACNYRDLREAVESLQSQPDWITQELDLADIQAIQQGGCASGAYMPAVTYYQANKTMAEYGDDVLGYIESELGELPQPDKGESWSGLAVFYLSCAVELWAGQFDLDGVDWD